MEWKRTRLKYNNFILRYNLFQSQEWLEKRENELSLLIRECCSDEERNLIYNLLHKFEYLRLVNIREFLNKVTSKIVNDWQCQEDNTKIVAVSGDYEPDSSHIFIPPLRTLLSIAGWYHGSRYVFFPEFIRVFKRIKKQQLNSVTIVLVDEFIGSGITMINRIRRIKDELENQCGIHNYSIKICVLACMEHSVPLIQNHNVEIYSPFRLKRGIKDNYIGSEYLKAVSYMSRLESILKERINNTNLPSFGYGNAEALYVCEGSGADFGNTPNSVFPIFWWPFYKDKDKTQRSTILHRANI